MRPCFSGHGRKARDERALSPGLVRPCGAFVAGRGAECRFLSDTPPGRTGARRIAPVRLARLGHGRAHAAGRDFCDHRAACLECLAAFSRRAAGTLERRRLFHGRRHSRRLALPRTAAGLSFAHQRPLSACGARLVARMRSRLGLDGGSARALSGLACHRPAATQPIQDAPRHRRRCAPLVLSRHPRAQPGNALAETGCSGGAEPGAGCRIRSHGRSGDKTPVRRHSPGQRAGAATLAGLCGLLRKRRHRAGRRAPVAGPFQCGARACKDFRYRPLWRNRRLRPARALFPGPGGVRRGIR